MRHQLFYLPYGNNIAVDSMVMPFLPFCCPYFFIVHNIVLLIKKIAEFAIILELNGYSDYLGIGLRDGNRSYF